MLSANLEEDPLDFLSKFDLQKRRDYYIRHFKHRNTIQYFEENPAVGDVILAAVQEATRPTPLPTPVPTPRDIHVPEDVASTPLPHIAQEDEQSHGNSDQHRIHDRSPPNVYNQDESDVFDPHHRGPLAVAHGVRSGGQTYCEDADESETEQASRKPLPLVNPEEFSLADASDGPGDRVAHWDSRLPRQAAQAAASLISQQLGTPQYRPRKRKHVTEESEGLDCAAEAEAEAELESLSLENPELCDPPSPSSGNGNPNHKQATTLDDSRACMPLTPEPTSTTTPEIEGSLPRPPSTGESPGEQIRPAEYNREFANLGEDLRSKLQMIAGGEALENTWHIFNFMAARLSSPASCTGAGHPVLKASSAPPSDERLKELGNFIVREEEREKQAKSAKSLARISKRVYLAELIGKYIEETEARKAEPKQKRRRTLRRLSVNDRFTNILFPKTKECKGKQPNKTGKGKQLKREKTPREKAKQTLEYWIHLGEPLARMAQRFGVAILAQLPKKLTDKDIFNIRRPHMEAFLDYIDFLHPDLKERLSNLSALLPGIVENGLPPKKIVLETYHSGQLAELYKQPLSGLFSFCTGRDSRRIHPTASPQRDQGRPAKSVESPPHGVGTDDECSSHSAVDYCKYACPSAPQGRSCHLRIGQESDTHVEESINLQSGDCSITAQREFLNIESPNSQSGSSPILEPIDLYARECSNASPSPHLLTAYGGDSLARSHVDLSPEPMDMTDGMDWTRHDQEDGTVNPKDLFAGDESHFEYLMDHIEPYREF